MDYTRARVLIHEKWLDFDEAHRSTSCAISKLEEAQRKQTAVFACDHVVEDLFEMILKTVKEQYGYSSSTIDSFRSKGRELFRQTPRDIQVIPGSVPGQLRVDWTCNDAGVLLKHHGENIFFYVCLHQDASCANRRPDLVHNSQGMPFQRPVSIAIFILIKNVANQHPANALARKYHFQHARLLSTASILF